MVRAKFDCVFQIIWVTFIVYSLSLSFTEAFMWCEVTLSIFFSIATHSFWRQRVVFHRFSRSYSLVNLIYHITYAIFILTCRTFSFMLRTFSCMMPTLAFNLSSTIWEGNKLIWKCHHIKFCRFSQNILWCMSLRHSLDALQTSDDLVNEWEMRQSLANNSSIWHIERERKMVNDTADYASNSLVHCHQFSITKGGSVF